MDANRGRCFAFCTLAFAISVMLSKSVFLQTWTGLRNLPKFAGTSFVTCPLVDILGKGKADAPEPEKASCPTPI